MVFGINEYCTPGAWCFQNFLIGGLSLLSVVCVSVVLWKTCRRRRDRSTEVTTPIGRLLDRLTLTLFIQDILYHAPGIFFPMDTNARPLWFVMKEPFNFNRKNVEHYLLFQFSREGMGMLSVFWHCLIAYSLSSFILGKRPTTRMLNMQLGRFVLIAAVVTSVRYTLFYNGGQLGLVVSFLLYDVAVVPVCIVIMLYYYYVAGMALHKAGMGRSTRPTESKSTSWLRSCCASIISHLRLAQADPSPSLQHDALSATARVEGGLQQQQIKNSSSEEDAAYGDSNGSSSGDLELGMDGKDAAITAEQIITVQRRDIRMHRDMIRRLLHISLAVALTWLLGMIIDLVCWLTWLTSREPVAGTILPSWLFVVGIIVLRLVGLIDAVFLGGLFGFGARRDKEKERQVRGRQRQRRRECRATEGDVDAHAAAVAAAHDARVDGNGDRDREFLRQHGDHHHSTDGGFTTIYNASSSQALPHPLPPASLTHAHTASGRLCQHHQKNTDVRKDGDSHTHTSSSPCYLCMRGYSESRMSSLDYSFADLEASRASQSHRGSLSHAHTHTCAGGSNGNDDTHTRVCGEGGASPSVAVRPRSRSRSRSMSQSNLSPSLCYSYSCATEPSHSSVAPAVVAVSTNGAHGAVGLTTNSVEGGGVSTNSRGAESSKRRNGGGFSANKSQGERREEQTTLRVFATTWNLGMVGAGDLQVELPKVLPRWIPEGYDMYVVGVQQCVCLKQLKALVHQHVGGPSAYSLVTEALSERRSKYGYMAVMVMARREDVISGAFEVRSQQVGVGLTRASVAMGVRYHDTTMVLIAAHFASDSKGRSRLSRRNQEAAAVLKHTSLSWDCDVFDVHLQHHHVLLLGDLNYRMAGTPAEVLRLVAESSAAEASHAEASTQWRVASYGRFSRPSQEQQQKQKKKGVFAWWQQQQAPGDERRSPASGWSWVRKLDELSRAVDQREVLWGFQEGAIRHPPSYRRTRGVDGGDYTDPRFLESLVYSTTSSSNNLAEKNDDDDDEAPPPAQPPAVVVASTGEHVAVVDTASNGVHNDRACDAQTETHVVVTEATPAVEAVAPSGMMTVGDGTKGGAAEDVQAVVVLGVDGVAGEGGERSGQVDVAVEEAQGSIGEGRRTDADNNNSNGDGGGVSCVDEPPAATQVVAALMCSLPVSSQPHAHTSSIDASHGACSNDTRSGVESQPPLSQQQQQQQQPQQQRHEGQSQQHSRPHQPHQENHHRRHHHHHHQHRHQQHRKPSERRMTSRVSSSSEAAALEYQRTPSYTDRVLTHSLPGRAGRLSWRHYDMADAVMLSDHRPVAAAIDICVDRRRPEEYSSPVPPVTNSCYVSSTHTGPMTSCSQLAIFRIVIDNPRFEPYKPKPPPSLAHGGGSRGRWPRPPPNSSADTQTATTTTDTLNPTSSLAVLFPIASEDPLVTRRHATGLREMMPRVLTLGSSTSAFSPRAPTHTHQSSEEVMYSPSTSPLADNDGCNGVSANQERASSVSAHQAAAPKVSPQPLRRYSSSSFPVTHSVIACPERSEHMLVKAWDNKGRCVGQAAVHLTKYKGLTDTVEAKADLSLGGAMTGHLHFGIKVVCGSVE